MDNADTLGLRNAVDNLYSFRNFLLNPEGYEEEALVDGLSTVQTLFRVVLPIMRPALISAAIVQFVMGLARLAISRDVPPQDYWPATAAVTAFASKYNPNRGALTASSVLTIVAPLAIFVALQNSAESQGPQSLIINPVFGFRDISRMLKQLGARVEQLDAVYAEIKLRSGETLRVEVSNATMIDMRGTVFITLQASSVSRAAPEPQQAPSEFPEEDVKLLMEQTGASREEAIEALREAGGDLVAAAMKLMQRRTNQK